MGRNAFGTTMRIILSLGESESESESKSKLEMETEMETEMEIGSIHPLTPLPSFPAPPTRTNASFGKLD